MDKTSPGKLLLFSIGLWAIGGCLLLVQWLTGDKTGTLYMGVFLLSMSGALGIIAYRDLSGLSERIARLERQLPPVNGDEDERNEAG